MLDVGRKKHSPRANSLASRHLLCKHAGVGCVYVTIRPRKTKTRALSLVRVSADEHHNPNLRFSHNTAMLTLKNIDSAAKQILVSRSSKKRKRIFVWCFWEGIKSLPLGLKLVIKNEIVQALAFLICYINTC